MLPYRVDPGDLFGLVEGRARGRSLEQLGAPLPRKAFDGLMHTADRLGLLYPETHELTERGRELALASGERRQDLLLEAMVGFEPYDLVIEAALKHGSGATTLDWIATWWGSRGYGRSEHNRSEGSSTFGRLADSARLGKYIQGRRGHSSRIEWADDVLNRVREMQEVVGRRDAPNQPPPLDNEEEEPPAIGTLPPVGRERSDVIELNLPLGPGKVVSLTAPARLTRGEKERLKTLIEHLIAEEPEGVDQGT